VPRTLSVRTGPVFVCFGHFFRTSPSFPSIPAFFLSWSFFFPFTTTLHIGSQNLFWFFCMPVSPRFFVLCLTSPCGTLRQIFLTGGTYFSWHFPPRPPRRSRKVTFVASFFCLTHLWGQVIFLHRQTTLSTILCHIVSCMTKRGVQLICDYLLF